MNEGPVLLIGGTRGTGQLIATRLAQEGTPVRIFARDPVAAGRRAPASAEIVRGDLTQPASLQPAVAGASQIIFTAGCRSGHPARERTIRRTEYEGVVNTIAAAERAGFAGRFLYMTASGVGTRSFWAWALNVYKGNTLVWRERAESAIRASSLAYTIIRTGVLLNREGGRHPVGVSQERLPLSPRYRISRADVATVFVAALRHPRTVRTTFEIAWDRDAEPWPDALDRLRRDDLTSASVSVP